MTQNSYSNIKRWILLILLFNSIGFCIYYTQQRTPYDISAYMKGLNQMFVNPQHNLTDIKQIQPIEFIKTILENEYNQTDLINFYDHVQKEYSLGLKCTRKPISTTNTSNFTINNSTSTNIR